LDSSAVVAYCHQTPARQYSHKCFTAAFQNFEKDELAFAKTLAHHFGLQHYISEVCDEEIVPLMQKMMLHQEEPVTSASPLAQYKVFEMAKANGITVLLDGQGADEILGGYHKYYNWYWLELFGRNQLKKSGELAYARELGIRESFGIKARFAAWLPQFSAALQQSRKAKKAFRHPDLHPDFAFLNKRRLSYSLPAHFDLNGALYFSTFVHGLEELLRMADRNSMAHSLEVRLPFLYHPLVEFLFTLPPHFKIHRGWTKWILRKSVQEKLPEEITWRKEKVGFEPPQKRWMSDKRVQEEITKAKELLVQKAILRPGVLHKKIQPHDAYVAENRDWKYWSASFLFR
jgi:asparagine synthase (glutamine-hydrolysing)